LKEPRVAFLLYFDGLYDPPYPKLVMDVIQSHTGAKFLKGHALDYAYNAHVTFRGGSRTEFTNHLYGIVNPVTPQALENWIHWRELIWKRAGVRYTEVTRQIPNSIIVQRSSRSFDFSQVKLNTLKQIDFAAMTPEAQIQLAYDSDVMIAHHGAGITNVLWMREGSVLVQVMPWYHCQWRGYEGYVQLAAVAGVHHLLYCIPKAQVEIEGTIPPTYNEVNQQPHLYQLRKMTLHQKNIDAMHQMAVTEWYNSRNLKAHYEKIKMVT
jgi:hypothetical protein